MESTMEKGRAQCGSLVLIYPSSWTLKHHVMLPLACPANLLLQVLQASDSKFCILLEAV